MGGTCFNGEGAVEKPSKILCLEDNLQDRELLEATLSGEQVSCEFVFATTKLEFESALERTVFDLIISDFTLPSYDGMSALAAARKMQAETPFIFVSGTIGEERAVEGLKNGATDYVLKDRRDRLVSAVQRALRETQERAERKKLEDQLRQSQKMEAIGQLAGGVAHDFNNILSIIQGNAELALMEPGKLDADTEECLSQIKQASKRAANLVRQLLAFGRKHTLRLETVNLKDLMRNLTTMLDRIIGEDVRLECHCDGELVVRADAGMMEQMVLNLVINARDAMPQGGRLLIGAKPVTIDELLVPPHSDVRAGEFICLSVSDSGTGIAPEHLSRIFEPFFTTKQVGKGTGLGLAMVYGIVKQHQGWINVMSQVGAGTTFEIFLPAVRVTAVPTTIPPVETALQGGTETILLVEDDDAVRFMTRRTLEGCGYKVVEAASGRKALAIWPSCKSEVDLLLTDIVMPDGINGHRLAEMLREQVPALKVIFVSGYNANGSTGDTTFLARGDNYFLQKPYHMHVLMNAIRACLGKARSFVT